MSEAQKELLKSYIQNNVAPILIDFADGKDITNSVLIESNCNIEDLNGHYEKEEFLPPKWYTGLVENNYKVLVINKIDSIGKEEQTKFVEILKYRKVSTFEIPNNVVIIVTANKINKETINEEIYSLVAHIEG